MAFLGRLSPFTIRVSHSENAANACTHADIFEEMLQQVTLVAEAHGGYAHIQVYDAVYRLLIMTDYDSMLTAPTLCLTMVLASPYSQYTLIIQC